MGQHGEHRELVSRMAGTLVRRGAAGLIGLAALLPGAPKACELALAFALDVSASVDAREYQLQMEGMAAALADDAVAAAILAQPGGVALAAYEWSGRRQHTVIQPWRLVASRAEIDAVAAALADHARVDVEYPTAIGYALGFGHGLMRRAPACRRKVIDLSGDGVGNEGFHPQSAYRAFDFTGITVNGLAIEGSDAHVTGYYRSELAHGADAFVEVADGFEDFARAMRRKLLRELQGGMVAQR